MVNLVQGVTKCAVIVLSESICKTSDIVNLHQRSAWGNTTVSLDLKKKATSAIIGMTMLSLDDSFWTFSVSGKVYGTSVRYN